MNLPSMRIEDSLLDGHRKKVHAFRRDLQLAMNNPQVEVVYAIGNAVFSHGYSQYPSTLGCVAHCIHLLKLV